MSHRTFRFRKLAFLLALALTLLPVGESLASYPELEEENRTREQVDTLSESIQRANHSLETLALEIEDHEAEIAGTKESIEEFEESLSLIYDKKERIRQSLYEYIQFLYESGMDKSLLSALLNSKSFSDFLNNRYYASEFFRGFREKWQEYQDIDAQIQKRIAELSAQKKRLKKEKRKLAESRERFLEEIASLKKALRKEQKKAKNAEAAANALRQRLAAMEAQEERDLEEWNTDEESSDWGEENVISDGTDFWESENQYDYEDQDLALLAGIIQAEAGSQPYEGKIAVGSVVMNRVESSRFPNTISGVIYSPHQFTPAGSGRLAVILAEGPNEECMQAARDVLNGTRNVTNLYFKSADYAAAHGIAGIQIADQVFH